MSSFPRLTSPLTDGSVVLRDYVERDIPEILIAYQDDPLLHVLTAFLAGLATLLRIVCRVAGTVLVCHRIDLLK